MLRKLIARRKLIRAHIDHGIDLIVGNFLEENVYPSLNEDKVKQLESLVRGKYFERVLRNIVGKVIRTHSYRREQGVGFTNDDFESLIQEFAVYFLENGTKDFIRFLSSKHSDLSEVEPAEVQKAYVTIAKRRLTEKGGIADKLLKDRRFTIEEPKGEKTVHIDELRDNRDVKKEQFPTSMAELKEVMRGLKQYINSKGKEVHRLIFNTWLNNAQNRSRKSILQILMDEDSPLKTELELNDGSIFRYFNQFKEMFRDAMFKMGYDLSEKQVKSLVASVVIRGDYMEPEKMVEKLRKDKSKKASDKDISDALLEIVKLLKD